MLFEHVKGNRFKLSKGSNSDFCISKMEEEQALQTIFRICVPELVKAFNTDVCLRHTSYRKITEQEVRKNLKKFTHDRHCEDPFPHTDFIRYYSKVGKYKPFYFLTRKAVVNMVSKKYDRPTLVVSWEWPGGTALFDVPVFKGDIISETTGEFEGILLEKRLTDQEKWGISKLEDQYGLQIITKKLVKVVVNQYNRKVYHLEGLIELKDVLNNLKKSKDHWDEKEYKSVVNGHTFLFGISKRPKIEETPEGNRGRICVGDYDSTTTKSWCWYAIDDLRAGELYYVNENMNKRNRECRVSKLQEQEALQYIRRFLIPKAVEHFHKYASGYKVTPEEVSKNLKKIVDRRPTEPTLGGWKCDIIAYGSNVGQKSYVYLDGLQFRFDISTNENGDLIAAYSTPISSNQHYYYVGKIPT